MFKINKICLTVKLLIPLLAFSVFASSAQSVKILRTNKVNNFLTNPKSIIGLTEKKLVTRQDLVVEWVKQVDSTDKLTMTNDLTHYYPSYTDHVQHRIRHDVVPPAYKRMQDEGATIEFDLNKALNNFYLDQLNKLGTHK